MRDALRCEIALKVRRPRVQVVTVAGREFEHDGPVGRGVNGFGRRHNNSLALWFTVLVCAPVYCRLRRRKGR